MHYYDDQLAVLFLLIWFLQQSHFPRVLQQKSNRTPIQAEHLSASLDVADLLCCFCFSGWLMEFMKRKGDCEFADLRRHGMVQSSNCGVGWGGHHLRLTFLESSFYHSVYTKILLVFYTNHFKKKKKKDILLFLKGPNHFLSTSNKLYSTVEVEEPESYHLGPFANWTHQLSSTFEAWQINSCFDVNLHTNIYIYIVAPIYWLRL